MARFLEDFGENVGRGGFAVGAGDDDDFAGNFEMAADVGVEFEGETTRNIAGVVVG